MGFLKSVIAAGAALAATASAAAVPIQKRDACSGGKWVGPYAIGGDGGSPFCETAWGGSYQPISEVQVWTDKVRIRGMQATYADGTISKMYGQRDETAASVKVDYSKGERFKTVTTYGTGDGKQLGHIYMETSAGQKLDIGKDTKGITAREINVGGGVLLGWYGNGGNDIDRMAFLFISSDIESIEVGDMKFPNPPKDGDDMQPLILSQQHYYNAQSSGNATWNFSGQQTQTSSKTFKQSTTGTFGDSIALEISGEILGVGAKATNTFSWEVSHTTETDSTTTEGINLTWGQGGSLLPGKGVSCSAYAQKGQGNFDYDAKVTMKLKDGSTYSYSEKGTLEAVAYSQAYISVKDDNSSSAPPGFTSGSVQGGSKL